MKNEPELLVPNVPASATGSMNGKLMALMRLTLPLVCAATKAAASAKVCRTTLVPPRYDPSMPGTDCAAAGTQATKACCNSFAVPSPATSMRIRKLKGRSTGVTLAVFQFVAKPPIRARFTPVTVTSPTHSPAGSPVAWAETTKRTPMNWLTDDRFSPSRSLIASTLWYTESAAGLANAAGLGRRAIFNTPPGANTLVVAAGSGTYCTPRLSGSQFMAP